MNQRTFLEIQKQKENLKGNEKLFYYLQEEKIECMKIQNARLNDLVTIINELVIKISDLEEVIRCK